MNANATLSVAAVLAEAATRHADRLAVVVGEEEVTFADLWRQTRAYAGALRERGVGPGSVVGVLVPNVADFPRAYYAVLALGGVVVPVHALLRAREVEYVLRDSGAALLVCAAPLLEQGAAGAAAAGVDVVSVMAPAGAAPFPRLEDLAAAAAPIGSYLPRDPSDPATILYTSGTTGEPKGAVNSHFCLVEQVNTSLLDTYDLRPGDVLLGALPLFHTFGQTCTMNTGFRAGSTLVMVPRFTGEAALSVMVERGCTVLFGVPTMYMALLEAHARRLAAGLPAPLPPLRYGISGGAAIPVAVLERFKDVFGVDVYEGYGLTETSPVATFNAIGVPPRPGTVGTPIWGVDVEIARPEVPEAIELLPRGELGEVVIRGHNLFAGYLNRPADTAAAVVDGWFRTGDLGTKDEDGYLRIVDRTKDMIVRNGYNVYPREVEEVLATHPAVARVAVFGLPDERVGEEVAAVVVLNAGASAGPEEIREFAAEAMAAYKYPRVVEVVDDLPMGPSGKVLKRVLVAQRRSAPSTP
jgi:long-chain acyl-CoA synthetase